MQDAHRGALEAVDRILNREPEADEVLRQTVAVLTERLDAVTWAAIAFAEGDELVVGPESGHRAPGASTLELPVVYQGRTVAVLRLESTRAGGVDEEERAVLERVALLVSAHCLVGWDTGGVPWSNVS